LSQAGVNAVTLVTTSSPPQAPYFEMSPNGSKATSEEGPLLAKRTFAKAAVSEKCQSSEIVFGGSGLQATSKGEKLTGN
jgi:hypothetical protein